MIEINNLRMEFPQRLSLQVDLAVEKGTTLAILGPNGAGKTTLLNIIALFQKPLSGSIKVFGEDILALKDKLRFRRKVAYVFPQAYLLNETVYENIALPLRLRGIYRKSKVDEMLVLLNIAGLKECRAHTLSQGQMHRVALARALVSGPELLLLDEPFLSLDRRYKESLNVDLRRILKLNKTTALLVTQDHDEALNLADQLAVMINGKIAQTGRPNDIFARPDLKEIADFIGIETVVEGRVISKKENLCSVKIGDIILEVVSEYLPSDDAFFCLRPQDVTLANNLEKSSARNHLRARITGIEPWRLEYKVVLSCGFKLVASLTGQSLEDMNLKIGDEVVASFKATAAHLIRR